VVLLKVTDLSVQYRTGKSTKTALTNVDFEIPDLGYTVGVVGESGSGKTTLGMSMMNLIEPPGRITSGRVEYMGRNVLEMSDLQLRKFRWQEVSMVFQSAMNSLNPVMSILSHIEEVIMIHESVSKSEARERALKLLSQVGIKSDRAQGYSHEFSGGMRQRVVIAMALALSPKLLIADEPTSALDVVVQRQILSLLKSRQTHEKLSMIFITHDIAVLEGLVDNIVVMHDGRVVEYGEIEKVLRNPSDPYTRMLLNSLLTLDSSKDVLRGR
jgi:ABC-type dipeptide/oligopeptide/nickel transport system ATPase component